MNTNRTKICVALRVVPVKGPDGRTTVHYDCVVGHGTVRHRHECQECPDYRPTVPVQSQRPPVLRPLPCVSLGGIVKRVGCVCRRLDVRVCANGHGHIQQGKDCETCSDYEADDDGSADDRERPPQPIA